MANFTFEKVSRQVYQESSDAVSCEKCNSPYGRDFKGDKTYLKDLKTHLPQPSTPQDRIRASHPASFLDVFVPHVGRFRPHLIHESTLYSSTFYS